MKTALTLLTLLALAASPTSAETWTETDDASDLPAGAQIPLGNGPLEQISGTMLSGGDADMYRIRIEEPGIFTATTRDMNSIDTQLWIFDEAGLGISFNDDDPGLRGLQSTVTGLFIPHAGDYYLAISTFDWDPNDGIHDLWEDQPYTGERPPDGPGAPGPVAGWNGFGFYNGSYTITLTGAGFAIVTATRRTSWSVIKSLY